MVESGVTTGDYLSGFLLGTRQALHDNGRESVTVTINEVSPFSVGVLIALFERAVGLYANSININAYHQPGVQAGKVAADAVIALQLKVVDFLQANRAMAMTSSQIATGIEGGTDPETVFKICEHLAANPSKGVRRQPASDPSKVTYQRA